MQLQCLKNSSTNFEKFENNLSISNDEVHDLGKLKSLRESPNQIAYENINRFIKGNFKLFV